MLQEENRALINKIVLRTRTKMTRNEIKTAELRYWGQI